MGEELKRFSGTPSGRSSILTGKKKFVRGFIIRPEQMMELLHDTYPNLPIPKDAKHEGIGLNDSGSDSKIEFYFTSALAPTEHCLALKPQVFFKMLVDLSMGLLPMDSELDGIEISRNFTVIMLRVTSSHWPPPRIQDGKMPLYHLRYEAGRMLLVDPSKAVEQEMRFRIQ